MKPTILLDLDGVFADLHRSVWDLHGLDPAVQIPGEWCGWKAYPGWTEDRMWGHPTLRTAEFWADLPKTPWCDELMEVVARFYPRAQRCFLTKPLPGAPGSAAGKQAWIERHFPGYDYLIGGGKSFCAAPGRTLLDDADHNADAFEAAGGDAVLFPRRWNRGHYMPDPLAYVLGRLERLGGGA